MNILLAFSPFIVFAILDRLAGSTYGLVGGVLVSAILVARESLHLRKSVKVLEIGTLILFASLALYTLAAKPNWSIVGVRLGVDAGLLVIVLVSMAIKQPFTVQYAREKVDREFWEAPEFVRTNYVITAVWALTFAVLVLADLLMLYRPDVPIRFGIIISLLALVGAFKFTSWYPERKQRA